MNPNLQEATVPKYRLSNNDPVSPVGGKVIYRQEADGTETVVFKQVKSGDGAHIATVFRNLVNGVAA